MPATHHPDRFTRFSWPISYTYLAMLFIKVLFLLLSFPTAAFLAERGRWFPDGLRSETLSARAAALCAKRVLLLLAVLKAWTTSRYPGSSCFCVAHYANDEKWLESSHHIFHPPDHNSQILVSDHRSIPDDIQH